MKKINIVKENKDFNNIINNGNTIKNNYLIIHYKKNILNKSRFGISVGTKIGKAHIRNKYKRILRNIVDENKNSYIYNNDYIIIFRKNSLELNYNEIKNNYNLLLNKIIDREEKYEK